MSLLHCFPACVCKLNSNALELTTDPKALKTRLEKTQGAHRSGVCWISLARGTAWGEEGENQHQRASARSWSSTLFVKAFLRAGESQM